MLNELTWFAVINIQLTVGTSVAGTAGTPVTAMCVGAGAPISTWVLVTFINVDLALLPYGDKKIWLLFVFKFLFPHFPAPDPLLLTFSYCCIHYVEKQKTNNNEGNNKTISQACVYYQIINHTECIDIRKLLIIQSQCYYQEYC